MLRDGDSDWAEVRYEFAWSDKDVGQKQDIECTCPRCWCSAGRQLDGQIPRCYWICRYYTLGFTSGTIYVFLYIFKQFHSSNALVGRQFQWPWTCRFSYIFTVSIMKKEGQSCRSMLMPHCTCVYKFSLVPLHYISFH